jgi:integrase
MPIDAFDVFSIESWLAGREEALTTRASNIGRLSSLFSFAERRGWIIKNPCRQLERIHIEPSVPRILSVEQCEKLMRWVQQHQPRAMAFASLALFAGVRPQETERIDWAAYKDGKVVIDAAASKVRRRRVVDLHDTARAWLEASKGSPLPMTGITRRRFLAKARALLGWTAWPQDVLRHTAASFLMAIHKDAGLVADWLGNSPGILLTHYRQLVTAEEAAAFWAIKP